MCDQFNWLNPTHNDHISYNEEDDISVWIENIINEDDDDNDDIDFDMIL